jgi:hypothetical protein
MAEKKPLLAYLIRENRSFVFRQSEILVFWPLSHQTRC